MKGDAQDKKARGKVLLDLFLIFFKLGAFTIGGGMAMIPLIENEISVKRSYIPQDKIVDTFAVAQSAPGVIAINAATLAGYQTAGMAGAVVSSIGVILPSFVTILAIAMLLVNFFDNAYVQNAFTGVRAGVTALIMVSAIKLGKRALKNWFAWVVFIGSVVLKEVFGVTPILLILGGAMFGLIYIFAKASWARRAKA